MWKLVGVDAFSYEDYPLVGRYPDEASAIMAARQRLATLRINQSSGLLDHVYVVRPDGTEFRVFSE